MEYSPSQAAAYLAGKIDEYVKQPARDTILGNVCKDRFARYARIPDGKACDFCKMLGSRGFVYHSEQRAGGDGNDFHPFCNCQIAVSFDPYLEVYKRNGVTVTRGYASDARVVQAGGDGSMALREVDIDELYDEYLEAGKSYSSGSRYKDYEKKSKLTQRQLADYADALRNAKTLDELYAVGQRIVDEWQPGAGGRDQHQWDFLSNLAKHREKELKAAAIEKETVAEREGGRKREPFIWSNQEIASIQRTEDLTALLSERHEIIVGEGFAGLSLSAQQAIVAGIDDASRLLGRAAVDRLQIIDMIGRGVDGFYDELTGTINISAKCSDYYLTAVHEYVHGIDWERGAAMRIGKTPYPYSESLVVIARRNIGLTNPKDRRYTDQLVAISGANEAIYQEIKTKPYELLARSVEYNMTGKKTALSDELVRLLEEGM